MYAPLTLTFTTLTSRRHPLLGSVAQPDASTNSQSSAGTPIDHSAATQKLRRPRKYLTGSRPDGQEAPVRHRSPTDLQFCATTIMSASPDPLRPPRSRTAEHASHPLLPHSIQCRPLSSPRARYRSAVWTTARLAFHPVRSLVRVLLEVARHVRRQRFTFDLFDPKQTQTCGTSWPRCASSVPLPTQPRDSATRPRYDDTERVFRDAKVFSCAGGFRAAGVDSPGR